MMAIVYEPPVLASLKHVLSITDAKEVPLTERRYGKFSLIAESDRIGLYGLLWTDKEDSVLHVIGHGEILQWLERLGKKVPDELGEWSYLGGGFLRADHEERRIVAYGSSTVLGPAPKVLIEGALHVEGYASVIRAYAKVPRFGPYDAKTLDWYDRNSFLE